MSSARSRGMGLRGLVLGGAVGSVGVVSSGCGLLAFVAYDYEKSREIQSDRENARIMARGDENSEANRQNVDINAPRWEFFSCDGAKDFNNDGKIDCESEIINKGKTEFYVGDSFAYIGRLRYCKGKELTFFNQNIPGAEIKERWKKIIPNDHFMFLLGGSLEQSASWHAYVTLDGAKIGDYRITVREDPSKAISKK